MRKCSIEIDLSDKGNNLYVFFGGIAAGIAMPPFEFYNASKIIHEHKIFIRDFSQSWYQNGLLGLTNDIHSTARLIKNRIDEISPDDVFFVGNSMGGYAAILFSTIIGVGEVIAFSPQTFISPVLRFKHKDARWKKKINNTYIRSIFKPKVWDLRNLLLRADSNRKISIHVSRDDRLDYIHALHIADIKGVKIFEYDGGGHNVVKLLRDQGRLPEIMSIGKSGCRDS